MKYYLVTYQTMVSDVDVVIDGSVLITLNGGANNVLEELTRELAKLDKRAQLACYECSDDEAFDLMVVADFY